MFKLEFGSRMAFCWMLLAVLVTGSLAREEVCYNNVEMACSSSSLSGTASCNARYGGIQNIESEIQVYVNSQLIKSYEYLLLATHFNSYQKNRPGFQKLYQHLSDRAYEHAVNLMKQLNRRGATSNFKAVHDGAAAIPRQTLRLEVDELHSLAMALDNEKQLSNGAIHVHTRAMHGHADSRDPETAQYFEEKFLGNQAEVVRKLSGYANDLSKLMNQQDPSLAVYLFDEYLSKQF